jgi:hypothetical protein
VWRSATVHNLTVADLHTFHVLAGRTPVLTHNQSGCTPRERADALRDNPNLTGEERLDKIARDAERGDVGAQGELDALERWSDAGARIDILPEVQNSGRRNPDVRKDGQLTEVKTRVEPLDDRYLKDQIAAANNQIKRSGLEGADRGAVEIQLQGAAGGATDGQIAEQVRGAFTPERGRSLERVAVYRDGELAGEWRRAPDGTVTQVFPR